MGRLLSVLTIGALALLAACSDTSNTVDSGAAGGITAASVERERALNQCRTRAAVLVNPAGRGGLGSANSYDLAVAQCLRNLDRSR